jgi:hypothetical protein
MFCHGYRTAPREKKPIRLQQPFLQRCWLVATYQYQTCLRKVRIVCRRCWPRYSGHSFTNMTVQAPATFAGRQSTHKCQKSVHPRIARRVWWWPRRAGWPRRRRLARLKLRGYVRQRRIPVPPPAPSAGIPTRCPERAEMGGGGGVIRRAILLQRQPDVGVDRHPPLQRRCHERPVDQACGQFHVTLCCCQLFACRHRPAVPARCCQGARFSSFSIRDYNCFRPA